VDESCTGWDGEAEIKVRYVVDTTVTGELYGCVLTDSNGLILGAPVDIGVLPGDAQGQVIYETDLLTCSEELAAGEPDTATLTCQCFEEQSGIERSDTDIGDFECQAVDLTIEKTCEEQDPLTGENAVTIVVTNPDDPRGASLADCVVTDPLAGFTSDPFDLAPGESKQFDTTVSGLTEPTLNEATVVCEIVGSAGKTIERTAEDECETSVCEMNVDRQVSCDGGATWVDQGFEDGTIESCSTLKDEDVLVRYVVRNGSSRSSGAAADLVNCVLTDSNGAVLAGPVDVGVIADGFEGLILEADPLACSVGADGEPGTVNLTCECFEEGSGLEVTDEDTASFDCQECELDLDKQISCDGGATYVDVGDVDESWTSRARAGTARPRSRCATWWTPR